MSEPQTTETNGTDAGLPASTPQASNGQGVDRAEATAGGGKNLIMPQKALTQRLRHAEEKGKRAALTAVEEQAKASGFASLQDMFSTIAGLKQQNKPTNGVNGQQRAQQRQRPDHSVEVRAEGRAEVDDRPKNGQPQQANNHRSWKQDQRWTRELEKERKAREGERRVRLGEERRRKDLERKLEAHEAERSLRESAIFAGVQDVDYAVTLLRRSIEGKTEEELHSFDEGKFFADLREQKPVLFGEVIRPVTTGTGSKAPPAPSPGQVAQGAAANGQIDAKKMNDKEYNALLARRGLNLGAAGV